MRPIVKGNCPKEADNISDKRYSPYSEAKEDLFDKIGEYCSFCELWGYSSSIAVEHVQSKEYKENNIAIYSALKEDWNNFLLACVHCNSIKGDKNVVLNNFHLPHLNNTFLSIEYEQGGLVKVNSNLNPQESVKALKLINLVGLDRRPGKPNYSHKDKRWRYRREAWELAKKYHSKFISHEVDEETLCDLAKGRGFWSVWMKVFENEQSVKTALIEAFTGTFEGCLDRDLNRN